MAHRHLITCRMRLDRLPGEGRAAYIDRRSKHVHARFEELKAALAVDFPEIQPSHAEPLISVLIFDMEDDRAAALTEYLAKQYADMILTRDRPLDFDLGRPSKS